MRLASRLVFLAASGLLTAVLVHFPASAAGQLELMFQLTVQGPPPVGETLQIAWTAPGWKQGPFLLCAPSVPGNYAPPPGPPIKPCRGGGTTYRVGFGAPQGEVGTYRFERVTVSGVITVIQQGTFTALRDNQTFGAIYRVGMVPNTAFTHSDPARGTFPMVCRQRGRSSKCRGHPARCPTRR